MPSPIERWFPVVHTLRTYDRDKAQSDLIAGLTVALFTIPQAMAYALIAGVPPSLGIYGAVVASILGAAFGSSELLVSGPTNAISVVLAANGALFMAHGQPYKMIFILTVLIGLIQLGAAAVRLGSFTRFVSESVLTGFTAGAGIYIAVNQLPAMLGRDKKLIDLELSLWGWNPPHNAIFDFVRSMLAIDDANVVALATGLSTLFLVRGLQRVQKTIKTRVPAPFLAVFLVSAAAFLFGLGEPGPHKLKLVQDIQPVTRALPGLFFRGVTLDDLRALAGPSIAIAVLGAVEAIAIGKSLATTAGHKFSANRQLIGEGLANLGSAFVGGFASSGSFTRSSVNYESGAVTRMASIFSGFLVLGIVLLFAPMANHIPVAVLAGTLVHVGIRLINVGKMRMSFKTTGSDRVVLLTTFFAVLLLQQLQYALFLGIGVSIFLALRRAEGFQIALLERREDGTLIERAIEQTDSDEVLAVDLQGELFFAAADVLVQRLDRLSELGPRFVVMRMTQAYNVDATCSEALAQIARKMRARGGRLVLTGVRPAMYETFQRAGLVTLLGKEAIFRLEPEVLASTNKAIDFAHQLAEEAAAVSSARKAAEAPSPPPDDAR